MTDVANTLKIGLQKQAFCVVTGPHDDSIVYDAGNSVVPFAPILLDSPVILHILCPAVFPDTIMKVHAEHLGHFSAMQSVPKIDQTLEGRLFRGLARIFGRNEVLRKYRSVLNETEALKAAVDIAEEKNVHPGIFSLIDAENTAPIGALLRSLLNMFDPASLQEVAQQPQADDPDHIVFLYLVQLLALIVARAMTDKDLATVMALANAPFLEMNFESPLSAASLLKPMYVPFYDTSRCKTQANQAGPRESLRYSYKLFTGYEMDKHGKDSSDSIGTDSLQWTEYSLQMKLQGHHMREKNNTPLWFVAPQMGDRLDMVTQTSILGDLPKTACYKILTVLMLDNVMAYIQCSLFGTINNMMPCHTNIEFTRTVLDKVQTMAKMAQVFAHQSKNTAVTGNAERKQKSKPNSLYISGVGFCGQDTGSTLLFGKVFTGPEGQRPKPPKSANSDVPPSNGTHVETAFGIAQTEVSEMLNAALSIDKSEQKTLRGRLKRKFRLPESETTSVEMFMFARYSDRFNSGEFTEVGCVKENSQEPNLSPRTNYQITVNHGALPMCLTTLVLTMRQAVIFTMGFFCTELARVYFSSPKIGDKQLCSSLIGIMLGLTFYAGRGITTQNVFRATYGSLLRVTAPMFVGAGKSTPDLLRLNEVEWLSHDDNMPSDVKSSLALIRDTKTAVGTIMKDHKKTYNRVQPMNSSSAKLDKLWVFSNPKFMIQAPLILPINMRVFAPHNNTAVRGSIKWGKLNWGVYPMWILSNRAVNTAMYMPRDRTIESKADESIDSMVKTVKAEVSIVQPCIELDRLLMIVPQLSDTKLDSLVAALKEEGIDVPDHEPPAKISKVAWSNDRLDIDEEENSSCSQEQSDTE